MPMTAAVVPMGLWGGSIVQHYVDSRISLIVVIVTVWSYDYIFVVYKYLICIFIFTCIVISVYNKKNVIF